MNKIIELRALLREKFPEARVAGREFGGDAASGVSASPPAVRIDDDVLQPGVFTELTSGRPWAPGGALSLGAVLGSCAASGKHAALIDAGDSFDPQSHGDAVCGGLLWVRCRTAAEAVKAADLLLRDGNIPVIVIDLQIQPARELRRIAGSSWFRLRALAEQTGAACAVFTPHPAIPSATLRVDIISPLTLDDLDVPRADLSARLRLEVKRRRRAAGF